jgi:hypothetical protein
VSFRPSLWKSMKYPIRARGTSVSTDWEICLRSRHWQSKMGTLHKLSATEEGIEILTCGVRRK